MSSAIAVKNRAHQRFTGGKVKEHRGYGYLGLARDFGMTGGADSTTRENAKRTAQEQSAPLVLVERASAAMACGMTRIGHG
jgi:hypothetical protein